MGLSRLAREIQLDYVHNVLSNLPCYLSLAETDFLTELFNAFGEFVELSLMWQSIGDDDGM
jgi:hypothetical protein